MTHTHTCNWAILHMWVHHIKTRVNESRYTHVKTSYHTLVICDRCLKTRCETRCHNIVRRYRMTVPTENTTSPKSTNSRNSNSSVSHGTDSNWDFVLLWICSVKFEFLDLVDFRDVVFSMESVIRTSCLEHFVLKHLVSKKLHVLCITKEIEWQDDQANLEGLGLWQQGQQRHPNSRNLESRNLETSNIAANKLKWCHHRMLQKLCVAICCSVLQRVAACCSVL